MTVYLVERVDGSDETPFEMDCAEQWIAAVEYFEHRGSKQIRDGEESFVIEVYEAGDESGERIQFECTRDGVERVYE